MKKQLIVVSSLAAFGFATLLADVTPAASSTSVKSADKKAQPAKQQPATLSDLSQDKNFSQMNIRFVQSYDAMRVSEQGKEASDKLQNQRQSLSTDIEKDQRKLAEKMDHYQNQAAVLSDEVRVNKEKELRTEQANLKTKVEESEYELKLAVQKTTEELAKDIEKAVTAVAKRENLDAVVDTMTGRVLYVADKLDITTVVVNQMNTDHAVKLAQNKKSQKSEVTVAANAKAPKASAQS
jgi:outer membrane protein